MAGSILSTIFSPKGLSIKSESSVASPVWQTLKVISVEIGGNSRSSDIPLATPSLADTAMNLDAIGNDLEVAKVIMPSDITVNALVDDMTTATAIMTAFDDEEATFSITSKSIITDNMAITDVEIDQSPEVLSAVKVSIKFSQVGGAESASFHPAQTADQSTFGSRVNTSNPFAATVSSVYNKIKSNATGLFA